MPACWRGRSCVLAVAAGALALFLLVAGAGAVFGEPETISPDAVPASEPQIAADERGNAIAVWTETDAVDPDVPSVSLVQFAFRPRI